MCQTPLCVAYRLDDGTFALDVVLFYTKMTTGRCYNTITSCIDEGCAIDIHGNKELLTLMLFLSLILKYCNNLVNSDLILQQGKPIFNIKSLRLFHE